MTRLPLDDRNSIPDRPGTLPSASTSRPAMTLNRLLSIPYQEVVPPAVEKNPSSTEVKNSSSYRYRFLLTITPMTLAGSQTVRWL